MALQLDEIDQALLAFSSGDNRRVSDAVGFDGARWFDAVTTALQTPIETPDYPGVRFAVQCADIAGAVATLARSNGRMLAALAWRGTEVERVIARWRPEQFVEISARDVARANPWAGHSGLHLLRRFGQDADANDEGATYFLGGVRGLDDRLCKRADMRGIADDNGHAPLALRLAGEPSPDMPVDDERWKVPPSLGVMLQPLEPLHRPSGPLYLAQTAGGDGTADARRRAIATVRTGSTSAARRSTSASRSTSRSIRRCRRSRSGRPPATPDATTSVARSASAARKTGASGRARLLEHARCAWPRWR